VDDEKKTMIARKIVADQAIPSLSPVALQLINAASDERTSARDLASIIQRDPGLATRLLKIVNSVSFATRTPVSSVSQAVVNLGFKRVRMMAFSLSLRDTFPFGKVGNMDYDYFWRTSLYRALIARNFVKASNDCPVDPEEAFFGGLILEVGALLMYQGAFSDQDKQSFPGLNLPLEEILRWEEGVVGINHRFIGSFAMESWGFPEPMAECQRFMGDSALEPQRAFLCVVVELARRATAFVFGESADSSVMYEQTQRLLGLEAERMDGLLAETFRNVEDLADYLQISLDSQEEMLDAFQKRKQTPE
jgi:HD-like signal output (HDOD) protein